MINTCKGAFSFPNISISILIVDLLDPNEYRRWSLYLMSIFQVIFAMISVFIVFFQCKPTSMLWNPTAGGTCWSPDVFDDFSYWVSAYTALTDIVLAVVPIRVFWKLQMPLSTKISVCIMMGLTFLSAIVTIVKATYLHLFTNHTDPCSFISPFPWSPSLLLLDKLLNLLSVGSCYVGDLGAVSVFFPLICIPRPLTKLSASNKTSSSSPLVSQLSAPFSAKRLILQRAPLAEATHIPARGPRLNSATFHPGKVLRLSPSFL
jgi:hypothetical protein